MSWKWIVKKNKIFKLNLHKIKVFHLYYSFKENNIENYKALYIIYIYIFVANYAIAYVYVIASLVKKIP